MRSDLESKIAAIAEMREAHLRALSERPGGVGWCVRHSDLADEIVRLLHEQLTDEFPELPPIAIIATGGYGRREMSPYSDIDLTVVPSDEAAPTLDQALRRLFQDLHWAFCTVLRLDVGYAYRLISDAPGLDAKTRTGLMDMRHIAGSYDVTRSLDRALSDTFVAGEFILAKISERETMFDKFNDSPYVVEPHLKEGAGGVRCFHCSNWIRNAIGDQPARPSEAFDTIVRYRNLLHLLAKKHQDFLSRQRQAEIADLIGMDVSVMMAEVVQAGDNLHAHYRRAREKLREGRFSLARNVLSVQGEARIVGTSDAGDAAVGIAIATRLGLEVSDLPIGQTEGLQGPAAVYAFSTGEKTLRNLDRCGLLEKLLPELTACRTLVPDDTVHTFTVFEHSLRVVRHLESLDPGTFLGDLMASVNDVEPLYLAALLHDVGKAIPERAHSEIGAEIAADLCRRWGLADGIGETVEWLVREHLTMARFIRVRDLENPDTVREFAEIVLDTTRLGLLTLLTWADVNAVGPGAWTPAQDTFLRELYRRTEAHLTSDSPPAPDPALYRQRLLRQLRSQATDPDQVNGFVESLPAYYLTSTPPDVIRLHMDFAQRAIQGAPTVELFHRSELSATEITVCTTDAPRLLTRLLGVLYAFDLSVTGIRASTTTTSPHVALDVFTVSFGGRPVPAATTKQVSAALLDVLEGRKTVEEILEARGKDPFRVQRIFTLTYVEGTPGILEIRAPRGRGMPYRFSRLIADQGWNVVSARVGQWAGNAAAAFYVLGPTGAPLTQEEVHRALGVER
ncbi:HD domain-containing protein [Fimbriimonas ginsengisoli]|uniref:Bifunctional uridylyltransferase/uridylyl-removing enzyme n=1 Tax=Fimbriimonas ginsengisoli Gsoil 348 TaxID=661478 RepID=A0A068NUC6_FIMGI|nr:HD domain-containing protein [Fimbriimonas ginsengisoli]AIE87113.1 UTP-GlnB uridylyltransferase, GlnD [Fimbriimonas ginsengisoli Gsoil 348]